MNSDSETFPGSGHDDPLSAQAWQAHREFVRAVAYRLLADEHGADDVAQDAALAALEQPKRAIADARAWLATVARNASRNLLRESSRRERREAWVARAESVPSAAEIDERLQTQTAVLAAVRALREPYRTAVWLRWYEDLPPREIARRTNTSVETVKSRLKRGLAELRVRLEREFGGPDDVRRALLPLVPIARPVVTVTSGAAIAVAVVALATWTTLFPSIERSWRARPALVPFEATLASGGTSALRTEHGSRVPAGTVEVPAGRTPAAAREAVRLVVVTGRVLDARTDEAVPVVRVDAMSDGRVVRSTTTSTDGAYRLVEVPDDARCVVRGDGADVVLGIEERRVLRDASGDRREDLRVHIGPTFRLAAARGLDRVPDGVLVRLVSEEAVDPWGRDRPEQVSEARTDLFADGATGVRFDRPVRASVVGSGARSAARLVAIAADGSVGARARVSVADGRHTDTVLLDFEPLVTAGGTVRGADGRPRAGARVEVASENDGRHEVVITDPDGRWHVERLFPGTLALRVEADACVPHEGRVPVSADAVPSDVLLTQCRVFEVRGRLASRTGTHVPVGAVRLRPVDDRPGERTVLATNASDAGTHEFAFASVPAGRYEVVPPMGDAFAWDPPSARVDVPGPAVGFTCRDDVPLIDVVLSAVDEHTVNRIEEFDARLLIDRYGLGRREALELQGDVPLVTAQDGVARFVRVPRDARGWWAIEAAGRRTAWGEISDLRRIGGERVGAARLVPSWCVDMWVGTRDRGGMRPVPGVRVLTAGGRQLGVTLEDGRVYLDAAYDPGRITLDAPGWRVDAWEGFSNGKLRRALDLHHVWLSRE